MGQREIVDNLPLQIARSNITTTAHGLFTILSHQINKSTTVLNHHEFVKTDPVTQKTETVAAGTIMTMTLQTQNINGELIATLTDEQGLIWYTESEQEAHGVGYSGKFTVFKQPDFSTTN